ncbi:conserved hypothetical protein [Ricinus communis]|uniref:Uncharacterized protein n=1 Tax=Ricinus communis TaxID=3988 RepID=B9SHQ8_RICCO|nr:conserved hypothetical protein [Ricinus communis]
MDALKSSPLSLTKLTLVGKLEKIPEWFNTLQNLRVLYLHWSRFNKLEILEVINFPALEHITLVEGVMPNLKELSIGNCDTLVMIHWGIQYLTNLQELTLMNVPKRVTECIRALSGVDRGDLSI